MHADHLPGVAQVHQRKYLIVVYAFGPRGGGLGHYVGVLDAQLIVFPFNLLRGADINIILECECKICIVDCFGNNFESFGDKFELFCAALALLDQPPLRSHDRFHIFIRNRRIRAVTIPQWVDLKIFHISLENLVEIPGRIDAARLARDFSIVIQNFTLFLAANLTPLFRIIHIRNSLQHEGLRWCDVVSAFQRNNCERSDLQHLNHGIVIMTHNVDLGLVCQTDHGRRHFIILGHSLGIQVQ
jgi:hypothetical protein